MIDLKNVCFYYPESTKSALKDINVKINKGEVILICGESGCGKTTITRLINGLIPYFYKGTSSGEVLINGVDVCESSIYETSKKVGSVFQNPRSQFFNLDTTSELAFGAENMGLQPEEIKQRINKTISNFQIYDLVDRDIFLLSGGEKQKIACASVSVLNPDIIVLDEPTSNLDVFAIEDIRILIENWKKQGKTVIIAEHRLYFLKGVADRILYMNKGCLEKTYTASEFEALSQEETENMGLRTLSFQRLIANTNSLQKNNSEVIFTDFYHRYKRSKNLTLNINRLIVPERAVIAVFGQNGAGKSTFARCLCGLEKNFKGKIKFQNKEFKNGQRIDKCYMVMQDVNHQLFTESVMDEISLSQKQLNERQVGKIMRSLDLEDFKDLHPMSLSGGQKQRVAIASAIASERDIIVFDEPTSGLDLHHMYQVATDLQQLSDMGKTLFIVSHDLEFIFKCCDYYIHIEKGEIRDSGYLDTSGSEKVLSYFSSALKFQDVSN